MRDQSKIYRIIRILESLKDNLWKKEKKIIEDIQKDIHKGFNITITKLRTNQQAPIFAEFK